MKFTYFSVAILAVLLSKNVIAITDGCKVPISDEKITKVYFSNGVGTAFDEASHQTRQLEIYYGVSGELDSIAKSDESFEFGLAYNESQGKGADIGQVFRQKMQEDNIQGNPFLLYTMIKEGYSYVEIVSRFPEITQDNIGELFELVSVVNIESLARNTDQERVESRHISFYLSDLAAGKRVAIVAHSQGNLFTNSAIKTILEQNPEYAASIRKIGVASPANRVVNGESIALGDDVDDYVTANDDLIIITGLGSIQPVLPGNIENLPATAVDVRSFSNHSFLRDYMDPDLPSREKIDEVFFRVINELEYPTKIAGEGALRVSLTWGFQPDVDLHVFEPNGTQVYYNNKVGPSGTLDVDDKLFYGPENYVVECRNIEIGTYSIGANYFFGAGPVEAIMTVFTGDNKTYGPKKVVFESRRGRAGDIDPTIIYDVRVIDDGNGNVRYVVDEFNVDNTLKDLGINAEEYHPDNFIKD